MSPPLPSRESLDPQVGLQGCVLTPHVQAHLWPLFTLHLKPTFLQSFRWVMLVPTCNPLQELFPLAARSSPFHFIWVTAKLLFIIQVGTLEIFPLRSHAHFLQFFAQMSPFQTALSSPAVQISKPHRLCTHLLMLPLPLPNCPPHHHIRQSLSTMRTGTLTVLTTAESSVPSKHV